MTTNARLLEACEMSAEIRELQRQITNLAKRRRARWLRANREGVTYQEIIETCGISPAVVFREIRRARDETKSPALAARLPTRRPANGKAG